MINEHPKCYIGLNEIAKRMDCSVRRIFHWNKDLAFPLQRWFFHPNAKGKPGAWAYCAFEERIQDWFLANEAVTRRYLQSKRMASNNGHARKQATPAESSGPGYANSPRP